MPQSQEAFSEGYLNITQTSGQTVFPLLVESDTGVDLFWIATDGSIFTNEDITFNSGTSFTGQFVHSISGNTIWTFPDATGTVLLNDNSATVTSKTFGSSNTISTGFTYTDGIKQTFNPDGTNAGVNVGGHTAEPSSPADGDIFYDSVALQLKGRVNGAWVDLGAGAGGGGALDDIELEGILVSNARNAINFNDTSKINILVTDEAGSDRGTVTATIVANSLVDADLQSGVFASITGIGTQSQTFDMNGNNIDNVLSLISADADPADSGAILLGNGEVIAWEASPTGTDVTITVDASENFLFSSSTNNIDFNSNPIANTVLADSLDANSQAIINADISSTTNTYGNLEQIANVTDSGCALNEILKVNSSAIWDCATDAGGAGASISAGDSSATIIDTGSDGQLGLIFDGADPSDTTGAINLANANQICWEASPIGSDICISVTANEEFFFSSTVSFIETNQAPFRGFTLADSLNLNGQPITQTGDPADIGTIRVLNADNAVCWESAPAGADICLQVDASENFIFDTDINAIEFNSNTILDLPL